MLLFHLALYYGVISMLICAQLSSPLDLLPEQNMIDFPQNAYLLLFFHEKPLLISIVSALLVGCITF